MDELARAVIRLPAPLYDKGRILARVFGKSFNKYVVDILDSSIAEWEKEHGELPTAPQE